MNQTDIQRQIELLRRRIDKELYLQFQAREPRMLYEPMVYLFEAGGKRIRPLLLILACQSVGGNLEECIHAALAIEILHTFTLVHDDIMDHDDVRRGRPTVHKKWDESTAILVGDGLVTIAYQVLLKTEHPHLKRIIQIFTDGLLVLCVGQALDKMFELQDTISMDAYEDMIEKKTTKLIEVACEIGAILGNGSEKEQLALKRYAHCLGKAFQIQDDLMDIFSEEKVSGKPMGSDLIEKKKTYPTIHFLNHSATSVKREFQTLWRKKDFGKKEILCIRELFIQESTYESTQQVIKELIAQALEHLSELKQGDARESLRRLTLMIRDRIS
ncbi:polyprenyl synthetase family protein [bacterium]|nr:polyprenyl synthetase family protein [bacterium]